MKFLRSSIAGFTVVPFLCRLLRSGCPVLPVMLFMCSAMAMETIDPGQPIYQKRVNLPMWPPGVLEQKQHPKPQELTPKERAQIEATANASMYRKAAYAAWILTGLSCIAAYLMKAREGIGIAIICALFSLASSIMAQTVHYGLRIGACVGAVALVALCYHPKVKDWSISHIWTKKETPTQGS